MNIIFLIITLIVGNIILMTQTTLFETILIDVFFLMLIYIGYIWNTYKELTFLTKIDISTLRQLEFGRHKFLSYFYITTFLCLFTLGGFSIIYFSIQFLHNIIDFKYLKGLANFLYIKHSSNNNNVIEIYMLYVTMISSYFFMPVFLQYKKISKYYKQKVLEIISSQKNIQLKMGNDFNIEVIKQIMYFSHIYISKEQGNEYAYYLDILNDDFFSFNNIKVGDFNFKYYEKKTTGSGKSRRTKITREDELFKGIILELDTNMKEGIYQLNNQHGYKKYKKMSINEGLYKIFFNKFYEKMYLLKRIIDNKETTNEKHSMLLSQKFQELNIKYLIAHKNKAYIFIEIDMQKLDFLTFYFQKSIKISYNIMEQDIKFLEETINKLLTFEEFKIENSNNNN